MRNGSILLFENNLQVLKVEKNDEFCFSFVFIWIQRNLSFIFIDIETKKGEEK